MSVESVRWQKRKSTYSRKCLILFGGDEEGRTPDLCIANAALCQTELHPHTAKFDDKNFIVKVSSFTGRLRAKASLSGRSHKRARLRFSR